MDHYGLWSITPAALAIALAIVTRNVVLSLFSAIALGGIVVCGGDPVAGLVHALERTLVGAIADPGHAKTILFTVLIGATVGVIGKSGATRAVVHALASRARSRRSVQMLSWVAGMFVFFDDYANCMIVGNAMRPLCDRHRVTRAKLAYIVDSTAAPVACLALVSTWVGYEVGVIEDGLKAAGVEIDAYAFFVQGWAYRFYPIWALLFVGVVAWTGRDWGPMRRAAVEAQQGAEPTDAGELPRGGVWLAIVPIAALLAVTLGALWWGGLEGLAEQARQQGQPPPARPQLFEVLGASDGLGAIVKGAFTALFSAIVLAVATRALSVRQSTEAALEGMKMLFEAIVVLLLAWSLSAIMKELGAAPYLVGVLHASLPAWLLPTVVFVVAAVVSFATGTSYGTMGILMPMVIPLGFALSPDSTIVLAASGSVLAGACFGDHCSPISDTTVLSSIGAGARLLEHVRTQLPYALAIGGISVVCGTLPAGLGVSPWLLLPIGFAASVALLRLLGKRSSLGS